MQIPTVTKSQKQILILLSSFRFLLINQLASLFSHKDPHRIKEWLIDLEKKQLVFIIKPKNKTKPYIICLNHKARYVLQKDPNIEETYLARLYREKKAGDDFIQRQLFIADTYIYFLRHKDKKTEIDFFTKQDLQGYDYFPHPMPDAYIDEVTTKEHYRYFLDYFERTISAKKLRFLISRYIKYYESGSWEENTNNTSFPTILLIFESQRKMWHIYHYAKALLEKSPTDDIEIFLTTKDKITLNKKTVNIWQKIEAENTI